MAGFPISGEVIINNLSGVLAPNQTVSITSEKLVPFSQNLYFDKIPPFGKKIIPVKFNSKPLLTNESDIIKITIGKQTLEKRVIVSAFYKHIYFIILGGFIIGSITIFISFVAYKRRRLSIS